MLTACCCFLCGCLESWPRWAQTLTCGRCELWECLDPLNWFQEFPVSPSKMSMQFFFFLNSITLSIYSQKENVKQVKWVFNLNLLYTETKLSSPLCVHIFLHRRSPGSVEVHHESHGSSSTDRPLALLRHRHVRHHRGWVLHRQIPHHLLQDRHWWEWQLGCGASLLQPAV